MMPTKLSALLSLALMLAGCGDPYQPCTTVEDCDPVTADLCVTPPGAAQGWCSLICWVDEDCPKGPEGELPICRPIGKAKVCSLP
jgi:hypothetical protein